MRLTAWIAAAVLIVDQISKYVVVHLMGLDRVGAIEVLPPWLNFRMAWNQGVNFGLFAGEDALTRWGLIALALVIVVWVWRWIARDGAARRGLLISAGLLIGGALGNVIDRLFYGAVADFLNMSLPFWRNPFSFNVADIAIFVGAVGLVFLSGETGAKRRR
ncbi:Lipoprotein signal peptidase [bioreactor metagenome]|uniref:Lipoprotein signal peptidase n=1 Tax=bioreactor metagenome TaxID=1076179 RepID=A0A644T4C6_9ZZZZ